MTPLSPFVQRFAGNKKPGLRRAMVTAGSRCLGSARCSSRWCRWWKCSQRVL